VSDEETPRFIRPMLATLADQPFSDPDWIFEPKLDGVRLIASRNGSEVALTSRNDIGQNPTYPEIVDAIAAIDTDRLVVDGEVVAFEDGRTSFARLQGRMQIRDAEKARRTGIAVYFYVFDLLHLDGRSTRDMPLRDRKSLLKESIAFEDPLRFSTHGNEHGIELYEAACERGWEGLIAKKADSVYRPGRRTRDWLKLKCVRRQEFVIGGFTEPQGSRAGFGALLVGYDYDGELRYAGKVGTGYSDELLRKLRSRMDELEVAESPFDEPVKETNVHWIRPELVVVAGFTEWTNDGRLRHPRFISLVEG
jgi:bifunctional non-homologous end joining protein LigD